MSHSDARCGSSPEFGQRANSVEEPNAAGARAQSPPSIQPVKDSQPALPIDMNKALAVAESSTLGLLALITGASPPEGVRELLLPPLDFDMPVPIAQTNSEPSTMRSPPHHFKTLPADLALLRNGNKTPPSAGPGAYDSTVIPPSHHARTLVLCFDGTGDQFDSDVCPHLYSCVASSPSRVSLRRTRTSCSSSRCSRRMTRVSRWYTIRSAAKASRASCETEVQTQRSRLVSGRTRSQRSRRHSGRRCTSPSTWLSAITLMRMSWVRRSFSKYPVFPS